MGNEASTKKASPSTTPLLISISPVADIVRAAKEEVRLPSSELGLNALFIGCKQKYDDARHACSVERETTSAGTVACVKAADEFRGCLQANLDVIKALAESAHTMKEDEYSPIGATARK